MNNRYHDTDLVSRVSTGEAASESYRQERAARIWRGIGYALIGLGVIVGGLMLERANASPQTVDRPSERPGPVCVDYGTGHYICEGY